MDWGEKDKGGKELVKFWKEHHADSQLMHKKNVIITKNLGIQLIMKPKVKGHNSTNLMQSIKDNP